MRKVFLCASIFTIAATSAAQNTTVVPSQYATTEASQSTTTPFGSSRPNRVQYLYDATLVAVPAMAIRGIELRGEGSSAAPAKAGVDIEIRMSTTTTPWFNPNTTYASNHGPNELTAFGRKIVNLPAQTGNTTPAPFETPFPLDVAFLYVRANGNLLIDYIVQAQPAGPYSHDTSFTFLAAFTPIGSACGGLIQSVNGGEATSLGATLDFDVTGVPAFGLALHTIGAQQLPSPIVLPFGGCLLQQSVDVLSPMILNGRDASITYPLHPNFRGFVVYGQSLALDPTLTSLTASESHQSVIGGFDPHSRIFNSQSASTPAGSVQLGVGIVTRLTY